jgi:hypothetical protein
MTNQALWEHSGHTRIKHSRYTRMKRSLQPEPCERHEASSMEEKPTPWQTSRNVRHVKVLAQKVVLYCTVPCSTVLYCSDRHIGAHTPYCNCPPGHALSLFGASLHIRSVLDGAALYSTVRSSTALCCLRYCTELHGAVLHCTVLHCTVLPCTGQCCTVLYCTVLYCTVLYCAGLHSLCWTVLHCTVRYCTGLYCMYCAAQ